MNRAVIGIGSNIEPEKHIGDARKQIAKYHTILSESQFIKTKPVGYTRQPDFLNGVFLVETKMNKKSLTKWLHDLENYLGRVRTKNKYGQRTIDLDIVVWNEEIVDEDVLKRDFLKKSVLEVLPELTHLFR